MNRPEKIKELLKSRKRLNKRLEEIEKIFQEEKENEEAWPGHASTRYQSAESDRQVLLSHLEMVEKELEKLGYQE